MAQSGKWKWKWKWIAGPGLRRVPQPKYPAKWCTVQGMKRQLEDAGRRQHGDGKAQRARATGRWSKLSEYDDALSSLPEYRGRGKQPAGGRKQPISRSGKQPMAGRDFAHFASSSSGHAQDQVKVNIFAH
jgi:hypothetical protein